MNIIAALKLFAPGSVHRLYICIAAFAGIRPAEIGRLKWLDIDLEERVIRLSSLGNENVLAQNCAYTGQFVRVVA